MEKYLSEPRPEFTRALLRVARSWRGVVVKAHEFARAELATARGEKAGRIAGQLATAPRSPEFEVITGVTI